MQTAVAEAVTEIPSFSPHIPQDDLTITPSAAEKLRELFSQLDEDDEVDSIRIFVTGGGCSGMSYGMTFTQDTFETDCFRTEDGYKIVVDAVALSFLKGVEIDFVDRGAGGASFVFNNAFAATTSGGGCGAGGCGGGGCG